MAHSSPQHISHFIPRALSGLLRRSLPAPRPWRTPGDSIAYGCSGTHSGDCGHNHRSLRTALVCLRRDDRSGSDRAIVRRDGMGGPRTLSEAELGFVVDLVLAESELG